MKEVAQYGEFLGYPLVIQKLKTIAVWDEVSGIQLVPFNGTEVAEHEKWFADLEVFRYLATNTPYTVDRNTKVAVSEFIRYTVESPMFAFFRIEHPQYGFIGHVSMNGIALDDMIFERAITIGEKQYWRQGIASTVGNMILKHAKELGFKKVMASTSEKNEGSKKNLTNQFGEGTVQAGRVRFELDLEMYT